MPRIEEVQTDLVDMEVQGRKRRRREEVEEVEELLVEWEEEEEIKEEVEVETNVKEEVECTEPPAKKSRKDWKDYDWLEDDSLEGQEV